MVNFMYSTTTLKKQSRPFCKYWVFSNFKHLLKCHVIDLELHRLTSLSFWNKKPGRKVSEIFRATRHRLLSYESRCLMPPPRGRDHSLVLLQDMLTTSGSWCAGSDTAEGASQQEEGGPCNHRHPTPDGTFTVRRASGVLQAESCPRP